MFFDFRAIFCFPVRFLSVRWRWTDKMLAGTFVLTLDDAKWHWTVYFLAGRFVNPQDCFFLSRVPSKITGIVRQLACGLFNQF